MTDDPARAFLAAVDAVGPAAAVADARRSGALEAVRATITAAGFADAAALLPAIAGELDRVDIETLPAIDIAAEQAWADAAAGLGDALGDPR